MLMTAYMSAEQGKTVEFPPRGLDAFVPKVAKGPGGRRAALRALCAFAVTAVHRKDAKGAKVPESYKSIPSDIPA